MPSLVKEGPTVGADGKKIDRRILRTRRAIEEAFERLIVDYDYDKITVSALAKEANINRKTFYLHYQSVDDVLDSMASNHARYMLNRITSEGFFDEVPFNMEHVAQSIGSIYREARLVNPIFMRKLPLDHLIEASKVQWEEVVTRERARKGLEPLENTGYYVQFFLGGMLKTYECWYNSGDNTSFDEIAHIVAYSLLRGLNGIMSE